MPGGSASGSKAGLPWGACGEGETDSGCRRAAWGLRGTRLGDVRPVRRACFSLAQRWWGRGAQQGQGLGCSGGRCGRAAQRVQNRNKWKHGGIISSIFSDLKGMKSTLEKEMRSSHCGSAEMNLTRVHEVAGSIPSMAQWGQDPGGCGCDVGCSCGDSMEAKQRATKKTV